MKITISPEYQKALSEVYDILKFMHPELVQRIPKKFYMFVEKNRDMNYITNVNPFIPLENQNLKEETINIIALIYRSYMASEDEKKEFLENDREEIKQIEEKKREKYDPDKLFEENNLEKNLIKNNINNNEIILDKEDKTSEINDNIDEKNPFKMENTSKSLMIVKNDSLYHQILNKIKNFFKKLFG